MKEVLGRRKGVEQLSDWCVGVSCPSSRIFSTKRYTDGRVFIKHEVKKWQINWPITDRKRPAEGAREGAPAQRAGNDFCRVPLSVVLANPDHLKSTSRRMLIWQECCSL